MWAELCILIELRSFFQKTQLLQSCVKLGALPRVALGAQPWAKLQNPVGIQTKSSNINFDCSRRVFLFHLR